MEIAVRLLSFNLYKAFLTGRLFILFMEKNKRYSKQKKMFYY